MKATVYGQARPQGSPRALIGKSGRAFVTEDTRGNRGYRSWRQSCTLEMMLDAPQTPVDGPVAVTLAVYVPRPKAHYRGGKHAAELKPNAPVYPATGIDLDKLQRCLGDAGTGVWWRDDSRIVRWNVERRFADDGPERIEVEAFTL